MTDLGTGPLRPETDLRFGRVELCLRDPDRTNELLVNRYGFDTGLDVGSADLRLHHLGDVEVRVRTLGDARVSRHAAMHGDTVSDVEILCSDPDETIRRARTADVEVLEYDGIVSIDMTGERTLCHTVGTLEPAPTSRRSESHIDHIALCLPHGTSDELASRYEQVFGFTRLEIGDCAEVGVDVAGMRSIVVRSGQAATIVLTEPSVPNRGGQTQRFVDRHGGPGVQHVALAFRDLCAAVTERRDRGVEFLDAPPGYYRDARRRLAGAELPWERIEELQILVDADDRGLLMQVFARPLTDNGAFFFELIQRAGAVGFGANNVRALFEATERAEINDSEDL